MKQKSKVRRTFKLNKGQNKPGTFKIKDAKLKY